MLTLYFTPPELDPIYFSEKILEYNSAVLVGIDAFELRSSDSDNNEKIDSYSFSADGVSKNGIKFEESVSVRKRTFVSQLEFLNTVDNLDDKEVLAEKEDILASGFLEKLSSFDDQPRAQDSEGRATRINRHQTRKHPPISARTEGGEKTPKSLSSPQQTSRQIC